MESVDNQAGIALERDASANGSPPAPPAPVAEAELTLIGFQEILHRLRKLNFHRFLRERLIRAYLKRIAACPADGLFITWQPLYFIILKTFIVAVASLLLFSTYPHLSSWLSVGLTFFRLHEIYNFQFPQKEFFDDLARGLLLLVIGYYGLYFLFYQAQALFSSFSVSTPRRTVYYIRGFLVRKDLHVIAVPSLDYFALKHNLLFRLLGLGTIMLKDRSGDRMKIRSLALAARAIRRMARLKMKENDPDAKAPKPD